MRVIQIDDTNATTSRRRMNGSNRISVCVAMREPSRTEATAEAAAAPPPTTQTASQCAHVRAYFYMCLFLCVFAVRHYFQLAHRLIACSCAFACEYMCLYAWMDELLLPFSRGATLRKQQCRACERLSHSVWAIGHWSATYRYMVYIYSII